MERVMTIDLQKAKFGDLFKDREGNIWEFHGDLFGWSEFPFVCSKKNFSARFDRYGSTDLGRITLVTPVAKDSPSTERAMTVDLTQAKAGDIYLDERDAEWLFIARTPGALSYVLASGETLGFFTKQGGHYHLDIELVRRKPEKKRLTGWLSITKRGVGFTHEKPLPNASASERIAIKPIDIEYIPGEGL
jgi:hypothetical protein